MNIVLLFIAEPYQCFHGAAIGFALAAEPGVRVTVWYADPGTPALLERIRASHGALALEVRRLR